MLAATAITAVNHDSLNHRADRIARGGRVTGRQVLFELCNGAVIDQLVIGWQAHDGAFRQTGNLLFHAFLLALQILEARHDGTGKIVIFFHLLDQLGDTAPRFGESRLHLVTATMRRTHLGIKFTLKMHGEPADDVRRQETIAQTGKGPLFQKAGGDGAVAASLPSRRLAPPAQARTHELVATDAAANQTAQKMFRALRASQGVACTAKFLIPRRARLDLARLDLIPQALIDDTQVGLVPHDPFALGIEPWDASKTTILIGDFDPFAPVEDAAANINLVVEDTFAQCGIAGERRGTPDAAIIFAVFPGAGRRDVFAIQNLADCLQAIAVGVKLEYPPDEGSLLLANRKSIRWTARGVEAEQLFHIAQNLAARCAATRCLSFEAPAGRVGDAGTLLLAYDPFESEGEIVDPTGGDGVEHHVMRGEQLAHVGEMLLIAAEAINIFDDENPGFAGLERGEGSLEAGALHRGARNAIVAVKLDQFHPMLLGIAFREQFLIVNG